MDITFEEYLKERIRIWDETKVFAETYIDEYSGELVDYYKNDYDKAEKIINDLDEKYLGVFDNTFILHKTNELNKWTPYVISKIALVDAHNGCVIAKHLGKNFRENNHRRLFLRKGIFKSVSESEMNEMFGWYKKNDKKYETRFLYIFKNEIGRIKIGQATNVEQRIGAIIKQSGIDIIVLNKIPNSAKYEKILHKLFSDNRHSGEWFTLNGSQVNWLCSLNEINIEFEVNYVLNKSKISI